MCGVESGGQGGARGDLRDGERAVPQQSRAVHGGPMCSLNLTRSILCSWASPLSDSSPTNRDDQNPNETFASTNGNDLVVNGTNLPYAVAAVSENGSGKLSGGLVKRSVRGRSCVACLLHQDTALPLHLSTTDHSSKAGVPGQGRTFDKQ